MADKCGYLVVYGDIGDVSGDNIGTIAVGWVVFDAPKIIGVWREPQALVYTLTADWRIVSPPSQQELILTIGYATEVALSRLRQNFPCDFRLIRDLDTKYKSKRCPDGGADLRLVGRCDLW